jgi:hypothetical protein
MSCYNLEILCFHNFYKALSTSPKAKWISSYVKVYLNRIFWVTSYNMHLTMYRGYLLVQATQVYWWMCKDHHSCEKIFSYDVDTFQIFRYSHLEKFKEGKSRNVALPTLPSCLLNIFHNQWTIENMYKKMEGLRERGILSARISQTKSG